MKFLEQHGYVRIPLFRNGVGHFQAQGSLDGRSVSVLVDTGASDTVFNYDLAKEMNLSLTKLARQGGGAGAARLDINQIEKAQFALGNFKPKVSALLTMDLTNVNQALGRRNSTPIDAVLGADVLEAHKAVIDYDSSSLYLKL